MFLVLVRPKDHNKLQFTPFLPLTLMVQDPHSIKLNPWFECCLICDKKYWLMRTLNSLFHFCWNSRGGLLSMAAIPEAYSKFYMSHFTDGFWKEPCFFSRGGEKLSVISKNSLFANTGLRTIGMFILGGTLPWAVAGLENIYKFITFPSNIYNVMKIRRIHEI